MRHVINQRPVRHCSWTGLSWYMVGETPPKWAATAAARRPSERRPGLPSAWFVEGRARVVQECALVPRTGYRLLLGSICRLMTVPPD
jgi:hypothetical protein